MKRLLIAFIAVAMLGFVTSQASAQGYGRGCGSGYGYGYGSTSYYRYSSPYRSYGYAQARPAHYRSYYNHYRPSYYPQHSYYRGQVHGHYRRGGVSVHFGY